MTLAETLPAGPEASPHLQACREEIACILRRSAVRITDHQALVLILRYEEDLSFEEIAEQMGIARQNVWAAHERACRVLADELARRGVRSPADF